MFSSKVVVLLAALAAPLSHRAEDAPSPPGNTPERAGPADAKAAPDLKAATPIPPAPTPAATPTPPAATPAQTATPTPGPDAATPPSPPQAAPESAPVPSGQWVFTSQYGWTWMPYAESYTWVPPDDYGEPYMYVYTSGYGWAWLAAPWVWGWGPWPWFGVGGPWAFGWYGWGAWREPWRYRYAPAPYAPFRPGGGAAVTGYGPYRAGAAAPPGFTPGGSSGFAPGAPAGAAPAPAPHGGGGFVPHR